MIQEQMDWLYWNRDRVDESDFWLWADSLSDGDIAQLGEFWLDHLDRSNTAGHAWFVVSGITHDYHQGYGLSQRQRRAICAYARQHWDQLRVGSLA
jgi:RimJ/RimL family protein N-acetyltransferase